MAEKFTIKKNNVAKAEFKHPKVAEENEAEDEIVDKNTNEEENEDDEFEKDSSDENQEDDENSEDEDSEKPLKKAKSKGTRKSPFKEGSELDMLMSGVEDAVCFKETDEIEVIPTIFSSFNRAVEVGGAPLDCLWYIHGPTHGGKSAFSAGLAVSFQQRDHLVVLIDVERTASKKWYGELGCDIDKMGYKKPKFLDDVVITITQLIDNFAKMKSEKRIEDDKRLLIIVDTLSEAKSKERAMKILAQARKGEDLDFRGHPIEQLIISYWLPLLINSMDENGVTVVMLAQERENQGKKGKYDKNYKEKGGQALAFDNSVKIRIWTEKKLVVKRGGEDVIAGKAHAFVVEKNKVGFPLGTGVFYTSSGEITKRGFDHAREVVTEAKHRGVLDDFFDGKDIKVSNINERVKYLYEHPEIVDELRESLNEEILNKIGASAL